MGRVFRSWRQVLVLAAALAFALQVAGPGWRRVRSAPSARDFASYYYAVQAARRGRDPYDKRVLSRLARRDGTRRAVHPFFYPPPFLLAVSWALPLRLATAYRAWFLVQPLLLLASLVAIRRWLPGPSTLLGIAAVLAFYSPIADNDWMGQSNLLVLALCTWGLLATERDRPVLGGALVGAAAMLKMSPALLVAWWLVRGRWRAAAAACAAGLLLGLATLPLLGLEGQLHFYRDVLPGFASGDYDGLTVPVTLWANHSIPNLWVQAIPSRSGLSAGARWGATATDLLVVGGAMWVLRRRDMDAISSACAAGCLLVLMVVVPVFAYEHHVSMLLLGWIAVAAAVGRGRLGRPWAAALAVAFVLAAWPLASWKALVAGAPAPWGWLGQEAKCFAAFTLGAACLVAALRPDSPPAGRAA